MLALYIGGGILTYLLVIFGLCYAYGRFNPYHYSMSDAAQMMIAFWPLTLIAVIPITIIYWVVVGVSYLGEKIRLKGAAPKLAALREEQRLREINNEVNSLEFFEDEASTSTFF